MKTQQIHPVLAAVIIILVLALAGFFFYKKQQPSEKPSPNMNPKGFRPPKGMEGGPGQPMPGGPAGAPAPNGPG